MARTFSQAELEAFLDEGLTAEEMSAIEQTLRADKQLTAQLAAIVNRRGGGIHSVGDIWRRNRISCPSREQLGSFLLGVLDGEVEDYVRFHVQTVGCRACQASLDDLQQQQADAAELRETRRRRYFQSSAGLLRKSD
jgi:hypothetical protein